MHSSLEVGVTPGYHGIVKETSDPELVYLKTELVPWSVTPIHGPTELARIVSLNSSQTKPLTCRI